MSPITSGMCVGEVVRLDRDHVDLEARLLSVIDSKYGKSRAGAPARLNRQHARQLRRSARQDRRHARHPRHSSSPPAADCWSTPPTTYSPAWSRPSGSRPGLKAVLPGCMISGTRWRSGPCWSGIARESMSRLRFRCCPPGLATYHRPLPTTTCRLLPSFLPWPPSASKAWWSRSRTRDRAACAYLDAVRPSPARLREQCE